MNFSFKCFWVRYHRIVEVITESYIIHRFLVHRFKFPIRMAVNLNLSPIGNRRLTVFHNVFYITIFVTPYIYFLWLWLAEMCINFALYTQSRYVWKLKCYINEIKSVYVTMLITEISCNFAKKSNVFTKPTCLLLKVAYLITRS